MRCCTQGPLTLTPIATRCGADRGHQLPQCFHAQASALTNPNRYSVRCRQGVPASAMLSCTSFSTRTQRGLHLFTRKTSIFRGETCLATNTMLKLSAPRSRRRGRRAPLSWWGAILVTTGCNSETAPLLPTKPFGRTRMRKTSKSSPGSPFFRRRTWYSSDREHDKLERTLK